MVEKEHDNMAKNIKIPMYFTGANAEKIKAPNAIFDAILMEDSDSENSYFIINEDFNLVSAEPLADNSWLEDAVTGTGSGFDSADAVLDFTERNPFGEPD